MLRPVVLLLTVVTGFTGLAYEVTWQKYLAILLGAHSEATASVLGLFLGGLSLGYWVFGALTRRLVQRGRERDRAPRLLVVYGAVEGGIGLYCLLFPVLFPLLRAASAWLPTGDGLLAFAVDVALSALLILPPAVLMGGTIPILTQALASDIDDATRIHANIYAFNTGGAFLGALVSGFVLVHWLGLAGVMVSMGLVNVVVGSVLAGMGLRRREIVDLDPGAGDVAPPASAAPAVYAVAALLIGFAMMVFQTVLIRMGGLSFGSSEYTFSMVVAVFVLCIALGSAAVSLLPRVSRHLLPAALWGLSALLAAHYFLLETGPYWAHALRSLFRDHVASFYPFYGSVFVALLAVIGPPVALSGAMLPLLFDALKREMGDLGARAGRLYSLNTVGSLAGALLGGYALLFWLDLHHVYRIGVAALVLAAAIVTSAQYVRLPFAGLAAVLGVALVGLAALPAWNPAYLASGVFRNRAPAYWTWQGPGAMPHHGFEHVFYDDDPNSSVAVLENGDEGDPHFSRAILVNGKPDGSSLGDFNTMALAALLPALLTDRVEHAFVIGYGTGVTAGELAVLDEVESVTVAEISAGVVAAAPLFDFVSQGASNHPKIDIVRSDAYRALLRGRRSYDVIVSEPSNPWVTGVEMLFSKEFLEEARDRLSPTGVYCQWYHLYETSDEAVELVLRTVASVFDHVAVWSVNGVDLLVMGLRDPSLALDLQRLERRMFEPGLAAGFARAGLRGPAALLAHEALPLGVVNAARLEGPIHSLYRPLLSYEAGRGFFAGEQGELPFLGYGEPARIGAARSLMRRRLDARWRGRPVPGEVYKRIVRRACTSYLSSCDTFLADWLRQGPDGAREEWVGELPQAGLHLQVANDIQPLFGPGDAAAGEGGAADGEAPQAPVGLVDALHVTQRYLALYTHAAPFDPRSLVSLWERCEAGPMVTASCADGLRVARTLRAGEPPPDASEWLDGRGEEVGTAVRGRATPGDGDS